MHHQHSFVHLETYIAAILLQGMDALIADFVFFEVEDTVAHPSVGIADGPRADVHHAAGLKGVEKQVVVELIQRVGGVVVVHELLATVHAMGVYVQPDVHVVRGPLLPVGSGGQGADRGYHHDYKPDDNVGHP